DWANPSCDPSNAVSAAKKVHMSFISAFLAPSIQAVWNRVCRQRKRTLTSTQCSKMSTELLFLSALHQRHRARDKQPSRCGHEGTTSLQPDRDRRKMS